MAAIITNKFRLSNAKMFIDNVSLQNYYMFIGRPYAWADDLVPPAPSDTVRVENDIWDGVTAMKKVGPGDVSHAIYHRKWTAGKYYDMYRHDYDGTKEGQNIDSGASTSPESLADSNYFVVTANNSIYVCMNNNGGIPSIVDPQSLGTGGSSFYPITGADGYTWKYIATTGSSEASRFQSTNYHPVKTLSSAPATGDPYEIQWSAQEIARTTYPGAIFVVEISNGGTGYSQSSPPAVTIDGDGSGATAVAYVSGAGNVVRIEMTNYGTNYSWSKITIGAPSSGTTAIASAILTPLKGLGADPVSDLSAYFVSLNSTFVESEGDGDFPVTNDYRQIGIIVNPNRPSSSLLLTTQTATACIALKLNPFNGVFAPDSIITSSSNAVGRIVDSYIDGTDRIVRIIRTQEENGVSLGSGAADFVQGNTVVTNIAGNTGTIADILNDTNGGLEVDKYTGDLIYYENRRAIQRSADQTEIIIVTFEF